MSGDFTHIEPLIAETVTKLDQAMTRKGSLTGAPTAITEFNKLTSGLQPGDLIITIGAGSVWKLGEGLAKQLGARS